MTKCGSGVTRQNEQFINAPSVDKVPRTTVGPMLLALNNPEYFTFRISVGLPITQHLAAHG